MATVTVHATIPEVVPSPATQPPVSPETPTTWLHSGDKAPAHGLKSRSKSLGSEAALPTPSSLQQRPRARRSGQQYGLAPWQLTGKPVDFTPQLLGDEGSCYGDVCGNFLGIVGTSLSACVAAAQRWQASRAQGVLDA